MTAWTSHPAPTLPDQDAPGVRRLRLSHPTEHGRRVGVRIEGGVEGERRPYVVLCHGFKGFMDWGFFPGLSRAIARSGHVAVSMNSSGCGVGEDPRTLDDDEGFFRDTYGRQLEDIAAVRAFARGLGSVDPEREALFGHSRGGGMMLLAAATDAPRAVALWAAIDDADRFDTATKERWRADGVLHVPNGRTGQVHRMSLAALDEFEADPARFDVLGAAARCEAPLLAVHGADDATVEPEAARRIASTAALGEALVIAGADHALGARHPCPDPDSVPALAEAIAATVAFLGTHAAR
ncbi:MAG: alpha/beta fold hydrolase [Planctomycetota bacterium]